MATTDNQNVTDQLLPSAVGELAHIRALMEAQLLAERDDLLQIVVGNFDRRESVLLDSPSPRARRLIVPRPGQGANGVAVAAATVLDLIEQNEGRLGGYVQNTGASPLRLYLCTPGDIGGVGQALSGQAGNRPSVFLPANATGEPFRFLLGQALYGGTVCAAGVGGATTVDWAEF